MKYVLTLACLLGAAVSGCAVYTPSGSVVVDPNNGPAHPHQRGGGFCPPGQAKKGNC